MIWLEWIVDMNCAHSTPPPDDDAIHTRHDNSRGRRTNQNARVTAICYIYSWILVFWFDDAYCQVVKEKKKLKGKKKYVKTYLVSDGSRWRCETTDCSHRSISHYWRSERWMSIIISCEITRFINSLILILSINLFNEMQEIDHWFSWINLYSFLNMIYE